jgi:hypothetical protein
VLTGRSGLGDAPVQVVDVAPEAVVRVGQIAVMLSA